MGRLQHGAADRPGVRGLHGPCRRRCHSSTSPRITALPLLAQDGTVFREIFDALQAEGTENATIAGWAAALDANMYARAAAWSTETFPYGSEFNYDTTGQEEVFVWLQRYNFTAQANSTLNAVLACAWLCVARVAAAALLY